MFLLMTYGNDGIELKDKGSILVNDHPGWLVYADSLLKLLLIL